MSKQVGYDFSILDAVMSTNQSQRMLVIDKVQQLLPDLKGTTIAVLGLAFKPNTDDLRCAPSLDIIPALLELGATIHAYDPVALEEAKHLLGHDRIHYYTDAYAALADVDGCVILTEWKQIIELDLFKVRNLMAQPHIVDGRNCYALETMAQLGFNYYSIGRANIQAIAHFY
jgi:UDPglucose 6-dehydrogenase